jgi:hypothetical protein
MAKPSLTPFKEALSSDYPDVRGSTWTEIFTAFEDVKESVGKRAAAAPPKKAYVMEIEISDTDSDDSEEEG